MKEELPDKTYELMVCDFFRHLKSCIKRPEQLYRNKTQQQLWYQQLLKWCDDDNLWFSAAREFFDIDEDALPIGTAILVDSALRYLSE